MNIVRCTLSALGMRKSEGADDVLELGSCLEKCDAQLASYEQTMCLSLREMCYEMGDIVGMGMSW